VITTPPPGDLFHEQSWRWKTIPPKLFLAPWRERGRCVCVFVVPYRRIFFFFFFFFFLVILLVFMAGAFFPPNKL
jgi:hypothetical protein